MDSWPHSTRRALVGDLNAAQKKKWSEFISDAASTPSWLRRAATISTIRLVKDTAADVQDRGNLLDGVSAAGCRSAPPTDEARWQTADASRDVQDEYCEWSVERDPTSKKITKVTFTCEVPRVLDDSSPQLKQDKNAGAFIGSSSVPPFTESDLSILTVSITTPRNRFNSSTSERRDAFDSGRSNTLKVKINIVARTRSPARLAVRLLDRRARTH